MRTRTRHFRRAYHPTSDNNFISIGFKGMGDNVVRFRKEYAENVLNFLLNALI
jgi:hypothetical protein